MRWLVIVEHEVDDVDLRANEGDLEGGVPEGIGWVRPEEVCRASSVLLCFRLAASVFLERTKISRHVYNKIEKLALEGDTACALQSCLSQCLCSNAS